LNKGPLTSLLLGSRRSAFTTSQISKFKDEIMAGVLADESDRKYLSEFNALKHHGFVEGRGGSSYKIFGADKYFSYTFWNEWPVTIRLNSVSKDVIFDIHHFEKEDLYYKFHFHPNVTPPIGGWICDACYEVGPHFHVGANLKLMANDCAISSIAFLAFVASWHHGAEQRFIAFKRFVKKQYALHGFSISAARI
jgi:hypothetical protein